MTRLIGSLLQWKGLLVGLVFVCTNTGNTPDVPAGRCIAEEAGGHDEERHFQIIKVQLRNVNR